MKYIVVLLVGAVVSLHLSFATCCLVLCPPGDKCCFESTVQSRFLKLNSVSDLPFDEVFMNVVVGCVQSVFFETITCVFPP